MTIVALPAILILLLLLGALAALIVGICIAKPAVRRVLLWVLGIILLVPVALFFLLIPMRVAHFQQPNAGQPIVVSQSVAEVPSVWREEIEEEFRTDVYSSPQSAAYGLGKQIADKHKTLLMGQLEIIKGAEAQTKSSGPKQIILCEDTADLKLFEQLRSGLKQSLSGLEILIQPRASEGPSEGQVWILLEVKEETRSVFLQEHQNAITNRTGVVQAVIQTEKDKLSEQVSYDYRPWIHEISDITNLYPRQLLIVFSETATDLQVAQTQVYDKACSILADSIIASGRQPIDIQRGNLEQFDMVADTYSQELKGMTGPVWRFALLVNADSEKLNELVQNKTQVVSQQRENWIKTGLSLLAMMVIIWIVYSVANAATKGYYSTLLAILAILAAILVGFLAFIA